ncbi:MAG TPA: class A beta-lactamase-related serine hydrolase [Candidatus Peribacteria bacterium]|nr:class A beta-lactamase-related serine hydrolase [Candidatus Peribacteria bacterium]
MAVALIAGYFLGGGWRNFNHCATRFTLLNPLIQCNLDKIPPFTPEYEEFESSLSEWIDTQKANGVISEGSVYFRDLTGGPWFGIRENAEFIPASLFKVPVMIAVLRASQDVPGLLAQQVIMSGAYAGLENVERPEESLQPGKAYTVDQLLDKMIMYSDNASADMLKNLLSSMDQTGQSVETIYEQLGMKVAANEHRLSVKTYATLFRMLFGGRYLTPALSQKALDLLSKSIYTDALVAGVPAGTLVAHKFGIRDVPGEPLKQFHDCGIVYYPGRPYLLCVMTRGSDTKNGIAFIREVSRRAYEQVDARVKTDRETLFDME